MKTLFPIHLNKLQIIFEFVANVFEEILSKRLNINKDSGRISLQHIYFKHESNSYYCVYRLIDDKCNMSTECDKVSFKEFDETYNEIYN